MMSDAGASGPSSPLGPGARLSRRGRTVRLPRSRCGALEPFHPDVRQPRSERRRSGMIAPATGRAGTGVRSATNRELVGRLARVAGAVLCRHGRDVHRHGA